MEKTVHRDNVGRLKCQQCGNEPAVTGHDINFVDLVEAQHRFLMVEDGEIVLEEAPEFNDAPPSEGYPFFECQGLVQDGPQHFRVCGARWPVPKWMIGLITYGGREDDEGVEEAALPSQPMHEVEQERAKAGLVDKVIIEEEYLKSFKCPNCGQGLEVGSSGRGIRYSEHIESWRQVRGLNAETGRFEIESRYEIGEGYDEGTDPYFQCMNCLETFPVPDWLLEWVDWTCDDWDLWMNRFALFPRLLAGLKTIGLTPDQLDGLCKMQNTSRERVQELLDRAEQYVEVSKPRPK